MRSYACLCAHCHHPSSPISPTITHLLLLPSITTHPTPPHPPPAIASACRIECQKRKIPPTKLNIFAQYITRVRRNIHLCVAMSPLGEAFRNRLRNFPSLVNCCTIDWFTNWPAEALQSVGLSIVQGEWG